MKPPTYVTPGRQTYKRQQHDSSQAQITLTVTGLVYNANLGLPLKLGWTDALRSAAVTEPRQGP